VKACAQITISLLGLVSLLGSAASAEPLRVVMLPIVVHSSAEDARYVSSGLADMLSSRLELLGEISVVRSEEGGTSELEDALESGAKAGGDYVIYGAFTQFGDGASLDVHCAPVGDIEEAAARRRIFVQSGNVSEIIPKLDTLVDRIAFYLNRPSSAPAPGQPTPASAAADDRTGASAAELASLRDRLDALEQAVYGLEEPITDAAAAPAEEPPPEP
jgi:hypothetical protein